MSQTVPRAPGSEPIYHMTACYWCWLPLRSDKAVVSDGHYFCDEKCVAANAEAKEPAP